MQEINLKNKSFYKNIQEYQNSKNNTKNSLKQAKTNDRPPLNATVSERLEYLIPKQWHKVTEKGTFTNYFLLK
jgi:hypothetical protein